MSAIQSCQQRRQQCREYRRQQRGQPMPSITRSPGGRGSGGQCRGGARPPVPQVPQPRLRAVNAALARGIDSGGDGRRKCSQQGGIQRCGPGGVECRQPGRIERSIKCREQGGIERRIECRQQGRLQRSQQAASASARMRRARLLQTPPEGGLGGGFEAASSAASNAASNFDPVGHSPEAGHRRAGADARRPASVPIPVHRRRHVLCRRHGAGGGNDCAGRGLANG